MSKLYTILLSLVAICCRAEQHVIELGATDVWRYNNVVFQPSASPAVPLALHAAQNASTSRVDSALVNRDSSVNRVLTGGVPLPSIDSLMAAQLFGAGRFVADHDSDLRVFVIVRDYRTAFQRVDSNNLPTFMANVQAFFARPFVAEDDPFAQLHIQFVISDHRYQQHDVLDIHATLAACERLAGSQWQAVATPDQAFWQTYSTTAIGQLVLASINYANEWIYQHYSANSIAGRITARRGERLQLSLTAPDVRIGETVALRHREQPNRVIGHLRVSALAGDHSFALPVDVHPAAIAVGDRLYVQRTPPPAALFLPPPPIVQCERDKSAKAGDNETTTTE